MYIEIRHKLIIFCGALPRSSFEKECFHLGLNYEIVNISLSCEL
jgi:hypothetical protein